MEISVISEHSNLTDKVVFVRGGMNVSLDQSGNIEDSFRLDALLETLGFLQNQNARVILCGHIGRNADETFEPVFNYLNKKLHNVSYNRETFKNVTQETVAEFSSDFSGIVSQVTAGDILLLDNVRQTDLEKSNSEDLARCIASNIDIYVNEAFPVAHRKHCSVDAVPRLLAKENKYFGLHFAREITEMQSVLDPQQPSLFVISGNKVNTKLPLITKFLDRYEHVLLGGVIANTFYKFQNKEVGASLIDQEVDEQEAQVIRETLSHPSLVLPQQVVVEKQNGTRETLDVNSVKDTDVIYDIAPESLAAIPFVEIKQALWNGPLGYYEKGYVEGSQTLLEELVKNVSRVTIGGGNTVAMANKHKLNREKVFLSTGGGSMLDYLADGSLPAIDAIIN